MLRQLRELDPYEAVSVREIASRFRVSPAVVNKITYNPESGFPKPHDGAGSRRAWLWFEVYDWYETHRIVKGRTGSHIPREENRYRNQNRAYRRAA